MDYDQALFWALGFLGVAAVLFFPGMMFAYWKFVVRHRLGDIRSKLWNQKAIDLYIKLFTSLKMEEWETELHGGPRLGAKSTEEFHAILVRDFKTVHGAPKYAWSVPSVTVVVALVVGTCCAWAKVRIEGSDDLVGQLDLTVILAMAGAYVWSVFGILSRYRSRDLVPEDLMEMFLRHIAAVPIGYSFSLLVIDQVAPALAFACAAFPLRELRLLMQERALKKQAAAPARGEDGLLGKVLDSLSEDTLARLKELNVATYMDLAYLNPTRLMARTGYSLRLILAWIDQALLVVHARPHKEKLARFGIARALDAQEFYREHIAGRPPAVWRAEPAVVALAGELAVPVDSVREMFKRVDADLHVRFLEAIRYAES